MSLTAELSYLTDDLPGIGGVIKQRRDDFLVEEQPLYEPCGEGEHLYLFIEKRGLTTPELVRRVARAFRAGRGDVGYAGLKDKHARTRQVLSVHLPGSEQQAVRDGLDRLSDRPDMQVLWADWHTNKLRRGHHAGNRFVIYVRDVSPTAVVSARRILERLVSTGAPNYIGAQRFGYRQNSHILGRHLLLGQSQAMLDELLAQPGDNDSEQLQTARAAFQRGDYDEALAHWPKTLRFDRQALDALRRGADAGAAVRAIDRQQRKFLVNAWQSAIFNDVLDRRLKDGALNELRFGDLAWKHDSRAVFAVDDAVVAEDNAADGRVASLAVSPSGPMWGVDMPRAAGEPGRVEVEALRNSGVEESQLLGAGDEAAEGARRPMRLPIKDAEFAGGGDERGPFVRLAFELPRGAYATVVLREIMKSEPLEASQTQNDHQDASHAAPTNRATDDAR
jgi:tRNA pseudouridine13 synthase